MQGDATGLRLCRTGSRRVMLRAHDLLNAAYVRCVRREEVRPPAYTSHIRTCRRRRPSSGPIPTGDALILHVHIIYAINFKY